MPQGKVSEHFGWGEFACPCGECSGWGDEHTQLAIQHTAEWLEKVRAALGNLPVKILSGYRCPSHNKAVGGVQDSQHLLGRAADIIVRDLSPATVQKICKAHWPGLIRGIGSARGYTHVDRREGTPATWRYT